MGAEEDGIGNNPNVAAGGDVDGDGVGDILLGAGGSETPANPNGFHHLFLGGDLGSARDIATSESTYAFEGEAYRDYSSVGSTFINDLDGDGLTDFVIGAPGNDAGGSSAGKVYLLMASELGTPGRRSLASTARQIVGDAGLLLGYNNADAGDVDGDGLSDLLLGAPGAYNNLPTQTSLVFLCFGDSLSSPAVQSAGDADLVLEGEQLDDDFGTQVHSAGDVDADGYADVIIATHLAEGSAGAAYIFLGSDLRSGAVGAVSDAAIKLVGRGSGDFIGYSAEGIGDIDNDGMGDIAISSSPAGGSVFGIFGSDLAVGGTYIAGSRASFTITGDGGEFGYALAGGDYNGDGRGDLAVGAVFLGRAYLMLGEHP